MPFFREDALKEKASNWHSIVNVRGGFYPIRMKQESSKAESPPTKEGALTIRYE
jgi:hypothetical protein